MSWRRAPAAEEEVALASAPHKPGLAVITETGFGICEDGSIGFSDCVLKQQQRVQQGPNPLVPSLASATKASGAAAEVTASSSSDDARAKEEDDRLMESTMYASLARGYSSIGSKCDGAAATASRCGGGPPTARRSLQLSCGASNLCQCEDGGVFETEGHFSDTARKYFSRDGHEDHSSAKKHHDGHGYGKHVKDAMNRVGKSVHEAYTRGKKRLGMHERMNGIVFEAITGVPYSKEAAAQHSVVDIFRTFPDGVPTHSEMSHEEVKEAGRLTAMLEMAREGVREAAITGDRLPANVVRFIQEIKDHFHGEEWGDRAEDILDKNKEHDKGYQDRIEEEKERFREMPTGRLMHILNAMRKSFHEPDDEYKWTRVERKKMEIVEGIIEEREKDAERDAKDRELYEKHGYKHLKKIHAHLSKNQDAHSKKHAVFIHDEITKRHSAHKARVAEKRETHRGRHGARG